MSCLPGMPCFGNHPNNPSAKTCGADPCFLYKTTTDLVNYIGPNLPCVEINTCETLTVALQKIDNALCGVNLSQTIINTIITNTYINQQFTTIINDLIDCQTIQDCISTTSTTSTACVCSTYVVSNPNYSYSISTTFLNCEGDFITISVGDTPAVICACEGSIDPQSLLVFTKIADGCISVPDVPTCGVFINSKEEGVKYYDPTSGISTSLYIPGVVGSEDIATTATKMWLYQESGLDTTIYEWDITLSPFTATFNRNITVLNFNFGPGLTAKDDYTLITTQDATGDVYEIDIAGPIGFETYLFSMAPGRVVTGDLLYTTTGKLLITNNESPGFGKYLTQYDYITGNVEVEIDLGFYAGVNATGLFEYNGEIYVGFCNPGDAALSYIGQFDKNYPYGLINYNLISYCPKGASNNPVCNDVIFNTTTTTTTALIPCYCYEVNTEDALNPGNYVIEWTNCDDTPGGPATVNNSIYNLCAKEGSLATVSGSGSYTETQGGICTGDTDCWRGFKIALEDTQRFNISRIEFSSPIIIDWGDGNTEYITSSPYTCSPGGVCEHVYTAVGGFTGDVTIKCADLGNITFLRLQNSFGVSPTGNEVATIVGAEITKLNKLEYLYSTTSVLNCAVTDLAPTLLVLSARAGVVTGSIANLPPSLEQIVLTNSGTIINGNTLSGNINTFPSTLNTITIAGDNTISGDILNLNVAYPSQLKEFTILGDNTISGNITSRFALYGSQFKRFSVGGYNTLYGTLNGAFPNSMDYISITGYSYPDGTTGAFTAMTSLRYLILDTYEDDPMLPASAGNSLSGNISALPSSLIFTNISGSNTVSGNIINMPAGATSSGTYFRVTGRVWGTHLTGGNTISGTVSDMKANCKFFILGGDNTMGGTIQSIPSGVIERFIVSGNSGALSGNVWGVPASLKVLSVIGGTSIATYQPSTAYPTLTPTKAWITGLNFIRINPNNAATDMSQNDTDQLIIDVAAVTWGTSGEYPTKTLEIQSVGRSSFSDAAYNSLLAQGVTVSIVPS